MFLEKQINKLIGKPIYCYSIIFIIVFFLLASFGIWLQMNHKIHYFDTDTFNFDNQMWSTVSGYGLFTPALDHYGLFTNQSNNYNPPVTLLSNSEFATHNAPIMFLVLILYYLIPSVYTLVLIRIILLGAAAIPLYLIGRELLDEKSAKIIAISYLIYPTIMWNTLYLYYSGYVPFFAFLLIYAYIKDKTALFYLSFALGLAIKEIEPLMLFPLGLYLLYDSKYTKILSNTIKYKYILSLILISPIYFIYSIKIFIPYFSSSASYNMITRFSYLGTTPLTIGYNTINELLSLNTLMYVLWLLVPVSFIPIMSLPSLAIAIPIFLQNALSRSEYQTMFIGHYNFEVIVAIFLSIIIYFAKKRSNSNYNNTIMLYFYLSIFWCIIFSLIRIYMFLHS